MKNALAIAALASFLVPAVRAEDAPRVPDAFLACAKIQDATARVRCYDAQVAAMKKGPARTVRAAPPAENAAPVTSVAPAAASPNSARSVPARASSAREDSPAAHFGEDDLPQSLRRNSNRGDDTLASSITGVSKDGPGIYVFSLANGQIWRGEGSRVALFLRAGDPIRITRGTLGSYHMWAPRLSAKNWIYVKRIR